MDIQELNIHTITDLRREYLARNPHGMYFDKKAMGNFGAKITARTVYGGRFFVEQIGAHFTVTEAYMARDGIRFISSGTYGSMDEARREAKYYAETRGS